MTRRAVVLFARTPEAEAAAKRLSRRAIPLFQSLIARWLRAAVEAGATPFIACERSSRARFGSIATDVRREFIDQNGETFGERLANAALSVAGYETIVITGIDAPPPRDLAKAFARLETHEVDAAIAPARDGGVNVIAFREVPLELLAGFVSGDTAIATHCRAAFERVHELERASDIDSFQDIARARFESTWLTFTSALAGCVDQRNEWADVLYVPMRPNSHVASRAPPSR